MKFKSTKFYLKYAKKFYLGKMVLKISSQFRIFLKEIYEIKIQKNFLSRQCKYLLFWQQDFKGFIHSYICINLYLHT